MPHRSSSCSARCRKPPEAPPSNATHASNPEGHTAPTGAVVSLIPFKEENMTQEQTSNSAEVTEPARYVIEEASILGRNRRILLTTLAQAGAVTVRTARSATP